MTEMNSVLVPLLVGVFGVWIGHRLTISLYEIRIKNLEYAFYEEWNLISDQLTPILRILVEEYRYPIVEKTIAFNDTCLEYMDAMAIELISLADVITSNHRKFISNFKSAFSGYEKEFRERDRIVDSNFSGVSINIPKGPNGRLISYLVEMIYQLDRITSMKRKYTFDHPNFNSIVESKVILDLGLPREVLLDAYGHTVQIN